MATKKTPQKPTLAKAPATPPAKAKKALTPATPVLDPKVAYDRLLARASALPGKDVPVARVSASIARVNIDSACRAITPHLALLPDVAPKVDPARIADLPALARAFEYAEKLMPKDASDGSIDAALAAVGPVRLAALSYLSAAAFGGLVDVGRVRKLRAGRGKLDIASDAVAIAGLFDDASAALTGKHPFTSEHLATLRDRGAWLVDRLKPSGAVRDPKGRSPAALVKDRFAKLLEDDYADLLKAAVAIWGVDGYRAHVPALHVQERHAPKTPTPAPKPTPKPTPKTTPKATKKAPPRAVP